METLTEDELRLLETMMEHKRDQIRITIFENERSDNLDAIRVREHWIADYRAEHELLRKIISPYRTSVPKTP